MTVTANYMRYCYSQYLIMVEPFVALKNSYALMPFITGLAIFFMGVGKCTSNTAIQVEGELSWIFPIQRWWIIVTS